MALKIGEKSSGMVGTLGREFLDTVVVKILNISGGASGWFRTATGVYTGPDGRIFVADFH